MKFFVLSLGVLAVVVLAQAKAAPADEAADNARVMVQEFVESVATQIDPNLESLAVEGFQVPLLTRSCTNAVCANICHSLGFSKGVCVSSVLCQCSN